MKELEILKGNYYLANLPGNKKKKPRRGIVEILAVPSGARCDVRLTRWVTPRPNACPLMVGQTIRSFHARSILRPVQQGEYISEAPGGKKLAPGDYHVQTFENGATRVYPDKPRSYPAPEMTGDVYYVATRAIYVLVRAPNEDVAQLLGEHYLRERFNDRLADTIRGLGLVPCVETLRLASKEEIKLSPIENGT